MFVKNWDRERWFLEFKIKYKEVKIVKGKFNNSNIIINYHIGVIGYSCADIIEKLK